MEFQVLGPVQAWAEGRPLDLGERKQRMVLAVLLLEPNQLVLLDRLVDLLWREDPPSSARRIVQAHVSRLRMAFLFGLSPLDRIAFLGASGFLAAVALGAAYLPAKRATRVDPMIALRYE